MLNIAVAKMGDRLATIDTGRKLGVCAPLGEEEVGPHLTQYGQGRDETYLPTKWHLDPSSVWPQQVMPKIGGCAPLGEGELRPHLIQSCLV